MKIKEKALVFLYSKNKNQFLLCSDKIKIPLKLDIKDSKISEKENEIFLDLSDQIKKIMELSCEEILSLNWGFISNINGEEFKQMIYLAFIDSNNPSTNKEDLKYEWLDLKDFIEKIEWHDNKELLRRVLTKAIRKEIYFNKKERELN